MYLFGISALALAMSGMPALALAEDNDNEGAEVRARVQMQVEAVREGQKQEAEVSREQQKQQLERAVSALADDDFELEDDEDQASSGDDLGRKIEVRKRQLDDEVASSTLSRREAIENANPVRLAVHSLLASRDLLDQKGGIGQQVSEVAREMNRSVASTTAAEAKIQTRSFLARFFFGGDKTSAEVIAQEATQNQTRIDKLSALLGQASTTEAVKATLNEQITALKEAQARLQALADKEKSAWGFFSWRF